jgi:hypothetical protein
MARCGLALDQRDAPSLAGKSDRSGTACHSTTEDEDFILQGIAPDLLEDSAICSETLYIYLTL